MMKTDFVDSIELSAQQMLDLLGLGVALKACVRADYYPALLKKKTIAYMLGKENPLGLALCTAIHQLGGLAEPFVLSLDPPSVIRTAALELSRVCDCIVIEHPRHESVLALAKYASVPVINAGSEHSRPVQEIADLITMFEHLPPEKKLEECKAVFDGPCTAACTSALFVCTKVGLQFVQLCNEKSEEIKPQLLKTAERNVKKSGGTYVVLNSSAEAYRCADFLFMDAPMGTKLPPDAEGVMRIDPSENLLAAMRAIFTRLLYSNPAAREPVLVEKLRRTLAIKLQTIFGFGETTE